MDQGGPVTGDTKVQGKTSGVHGDQAARLVTGGGCGWRNGSQEAAAGGATDLRDGGGAKDS